MAQRFLPSVTEGDKRILLVDGEPLGAVNRKPKQVNSQQSGGGGHPEATELVTGSIGSQPRAGLTGGGCSS